VLLVLWTLPCEVFWALFGSSFTADALRFDIAAALLISDFAIEIIRVVKVITFGGDSSGIM
jgi:hypothetical protein